MPGPVPSPQAPPDHLDLLPTSDSTTTIALREFLTQNKQPIGPNDEVLVVKVNVT